MRRIFIFMLLLLFVLSVFCACSSPNEEILQRLESLEKQVTAINERIVETDADSEEEEEPTPEPTEALSPTPEPESGLSYETIIDLLGKANVMDGLNDTFWSGTIFISPEEYFIYLTYDCTFTEEVINIIDQNLKTSYGAGFPGEEEGFTGDGDYISFGQEDNGMISIGFELSGIETASKIFQLDNEYFSKYDDFMISQDVIDEFNLPQPTHCFNFQETDSISLSMDWNLSEQQAKQLAAYFKDLFPGEKAKEFTEIGIEIKGYNDSGEEVVYSAVCRDDTFETSIVQSYK